MCNFVKYSGASPKKTYLQWLEAIDIHNEHKFSFRDSAIIAAAIEGGAGILLSEDLTDKQQIKGLVIKNPFI